jgi:hypothetical protein
MRAYWQTTKLVCVVPILYLPLFYKGGSYVSDVTLYILIVSSVVVAVLKYVMYNDESKCTSTSINKYIINRS